MTTGLRHRTSPVLTATYRLQLHKDFPLSRAREVVPYLARLGISHLYCSPLLMARAGSTHGYDVTDPARLNPELGDERELEGLAADLRARGMGLLLDIVPNHMGTGAANPYWMDVLARGRESRYAPWFDIDWSPPQRGLGGKVMLPVLENELHQVLENAELSIRVERGTPSLAYRDSTFPLSVASIRHLEGSDFHPDSAAGRRRLIELLEAQHYRLAHWRRAARELNYRRFFDINDLVALRMEDRAVFAETHRLVLEWVERGIVDGFRIDHIDGLLDPLSYLERLRSEVKARGRDADFPIVVEKILSPGERLRRAWPVEGTTGYEFLNDVEALFLEPEGTAHIEAAYRRLSGSGTARFGFAETVVQGKRKVLRGPLATDVRRLTRLLAAARPQLRPRTSGAAIVELIAQLPVYRTYLDGRRRSPDPADRAVIERAIQGARRQRTHGRVAAQIGRLLLTASDDAARAFVGRFQQTSGPATAKGVEDTAHYRYVPLASRNEVGGDPERDLSDAMETLHRANRERGRHWPRSLVATNTHDAKRSADLRARLDVLTEMADEWTRMVARWHRAHRQIGNRVGQRFLPDSGTRYLLYQSLVGLWPMAPPDASELASLRERVGEYMAKAVREAKLGTSWTGPHEGFERATAAFVDALFDARGATFRDELDALVRRIARAGLRNALSRVVVHLTAPGTPDTYQGDELWSFALVDPDNRRPVDFAARASALDALAQSDRPRLATSSAELARTIEDGRLKLHVVNTLLELRRAQPDLFISGSYEPLRVTGRYARHAFAFARRQGKRIMVVVVSRLTLDLPATGAADPLGESWSHTELRLPSDLGRARWRCVITGRELRLEPAERTMPLSRVFELLPLSVLMTSV